MKSFTEEIKNEITAQTVEDRACRLAMLSAFVRTGGSILLRNGKYGFELVTENEQTADFFSDMLENGLPTAFSGVSFDYKSERNKMTFECLNENSDKLLRELQIIGRVKGEDAFITGIDDALVSNKKCRLSYLKGAFLGGGCCTLPEENIYSRTGYHFEIVFNNKQIASDFCDLLCGFEILAKLVTRKETTVVYVKSKEVISDILSIMSCPESLEKLNRLVEQKDRQNNANRVNNCSVSNIDKTVTASVKQVQAIEVISQTIGLQALEKPIFDVAACRLADKNASMQELAERLNISKSCINHRMRKILEIARTLSQD